MARIVILTEGHSNPDSAKTATGLLRYRPREVVALLDSTCVGRTTQEVLGVGGEIPFVRRLADCKADTLVIGIAPAGGALPKAWRRVIREALRRRMHVVSGLHTFLADDREFSRLAREHRARITDLRRPRPDLTVSADAAKRTRCHRIHTVGHDCSVGKMVTALEVTRALQRRGRDAEFVATGQTGILISGWGPPIDRVPSDFVAGAIEEAVLEHQDQEFLLIEGQGSLLHPFYSGVTLGLLHGCAPQTLILVFDPTRKVVKHTDVRMPPIGDVARLFEQMAGLVCPSRVVALSANTSKLSARAAAEVVARTEERLGIVTVDVIREGPDRIIDAILQRHRDLGLDRKRGPSRKK